MTGKELAETFGTLNWTLNFYNFCEVLKLNPQHDSARESWQAFQRFCEGLRRFDNAQLDALINHHCTTSNQK